MTYWKHCPDCGLDIPEDWGDRIAVGRSCYFCGQSTAWATEDEQGCEPPPKPEVVRFASSGIVASGDGWTVWRMTFPDGTHHTVEYRYCPNTLAYYDAARDRPRRAPKPKRKGGKRRK